ncbi:outer membrane beta-barrel protein [Flavobacterium sp.]|uniref:outer membrane beta-barrel protein n=1 Tax=Flavobacterium sp. TaxID=239 RepID=UPI0037C0702E
MKNLLMTAMLFTSISVFAQDESTKKIHAGLGYALTNNNSELFNNPLHAFGIYRIKKWDNVDLNVGLRVFYYNSNETDFYANKWGFNPNFNLAYNFKNTKLSSYASVGYYFDSFKSNATINNLVITPERNVTSNGVTFTPGLKYFVYKNLFLDTNLTIISAKTEDVFFKSDSSTNTFFNLGLGVAF